MATLHNAATVGVAVMGGSLVAMGFNAIADPQKGGTNFGLATTGSHWVPVWGVRDFGFGAAILSLLAAGKIGMLKNGEWEKAAAIVTIAGAGVGAADAWILTQHQAAGVAGHLTGASAMAAFALGLWYSS